jgi:uncharacterized membrane protein YgcG
LRPIPSQHVAAVGGFLNYCRVTRLAAAARVPVSPRRRAIDWLLAVLLIVALFTLVRQKARGDALRRRRRRHVAGGSGGDGGGDGGWDGGNGGTNGGGNGGGD